jgi:hypothetical protein
MADTPTAQTAINVLEQLKDKLGAATIAYWVTPNSILTLSGARAYCDGVFYHSSEKQLEEWTAEMAQSIEVLQSLTDIYFAEAKIDKSSSRESYAGYDAIFTNGLNFVLDSTELLNGSKFDLVQQKLRGEELIGAICTLIKQDERFKHFSRENLNHMAFGILVGYPDTAILGSVLELEEDDPFAEPLIDADIRGSWYYICPRPVYSYPRHLVNNIIINTHEQLWSGILRDFYTSSFHETLAKDLAFKSKANELGLYR